MEDGANASINLRIRRYVLGVLVVVYTFNFIDRQILSILMKSIKADLGLSDQALGLLAGFAFAACYASIGIPLALWADRRNRRNLISLSLAVWSAMTAVCGLAQNFWQLALARIGVGIALQTASERLMRLRRFLRSAHNASGMPMLA